MVELVELVELETELEDIEDLEAEVELDMILEMVEIEQTERTQMIE